MIIHSVLQMGTDHSNHCEDFLTVEPIGRHQWLCAVMDGCTMGKDSYFVSTLMGKLLRKIAKARYFREFVETPTFTNGSLLKSICNELFLELNIIRNHLFLDKYELLSTLVLAIVDTEKWDAHTLVVGDGVIVVNEEVIEFQQDNRPDYLGYHLDMDFETWFAAQSQKRYFQNIEDFSISTDGIFTFGGFDNRQLQKNAVEYLLVNRAWVHHEDMFGIKLRDMEINDGLKPSDDLAMIRLVRKIADEYDTAFIRFAL